jgi:hypothetical protein
MACHEVAALRLGLMRVIGLEDEAERQHELAELGDALSTPGPLTRLAEGSDLRTLSEAFAAALVELDRRVSATGSDSPQMPYLRTLLVLTRSVELELTRQIASVRSLFQDLEHMHDLVHEIHPAD